MTKVVTVLGARPQFVKASVVSKSFADAGVTEHIVHTGQHYDRAMSDIFFEEMGIPAPTHHLGIGSGAHGAQTAAMLAAIESVLVAETPDWMVVYGDTNSTLAGALAAAKLHIPIAHVEAGLRSFNRRMPEEVNRVTTDHLSTLLLCPTHDARELLRAEGVIGCEPTHGVWRQVEVVGDVMYDAAPAFGSIARERSTLIARLGLKPGGFVLATIHRAENTDDLHRLGVIVDALALIGRRERVVLPVHPRTRKVMEARGFGSRLGEAVTMIDPIGYFDMLACESNARCIVTDSGGVQKEAFFAQVPCVTLRDETEWRELVDGGWNTLVSPTDPHAIAQAVAQAGPGRPLAGIYGDGTAAKRVAALISSASSARVAMVSQSSARRA